MAADKAATLRWGHAVLAYGKAGHWLIVAFGARCLRAYVWRIRARASAERHGCRLVAAATAAAAGATKAAAAAQTRSTGD